MQNTNVPKGWNIKSMGDCFRCLRTKSFSRAETTDSGDVKYVHYGDIHTKYPLIISPKEIDLFISTEQAVNADLLRSGDLILLDASEDYEGTTKCIELSKVLPEDKIISGLHTMALRDDHGIFANNFKAYITSMPYVKQNFWKQISGVKVYGISKDNLKKIKVLVPPIEEQKKIAEILETWDRAIEELSDLIAEKKELKRGLMQQLLTGAKRLPNFNKQWENIKMGDIADLYQPTTIAAQDLLDEGFPVYGANGLIGYYDKYNHDTWQIMITCRGSTCGTVNRTYEKSWITGNAMVINCDKYNVCKPFLYYMLLNQNFSSVISGSGQPQIVRAPLLKYQLFLPSDIEEQKAIADVLTKADAEIDLLNQQLDVLKEQKRGLMQKLLTGEIRVKVDNE